jgi:hypothetical protein
MSELPLPPNYDQQPEHIKELILKYLNHLDKFEQKAYTIALGHLGTSFNLLKSNGYIDWLKTQK